MADNVAFVFPGQGSQFVGMIDELARNFPVAGSIFAEASAVLGYDLLSLCLNGPEQQLNQTEYTQPALLAASYACWRIWLERGGARPAYMAGHSLGEYSALVCAGALSFSDAVGLVAQRGRLMQQAVSESAGAMAAISGLDDDKVVEVCAEAAQGEVVSAANFNFPGQVVISGNCAAVDRAAALAKASGARRVTPLPISAPSHCSLMAPAAERLQQLVNGLCFMPAEIPVVQNVDANVRTDPREMQQALVLQLHQSVLWSRCVTVMQQRGVSTMIECGPGKVLNGLLRRIDKNIVCANIADMNSLNAALLI